MAPLALSLGVSSWCLHNETAVTPFVGMGLEDERVVDERVAYWIRARGSNADAAVGILRSSLRITH